ncbi:hypothetical protein DSO57_1009085 [Entomophthora muscae]|uniref:Uncharacterized protein n=1 Tax=Entomophthora muscae TaxID=34485 RepID=A0ACC2S9E9_9FUNG|nr:hypothetical protein DSO57_1009085 [Entomophthora muscae]
MLLPIDKSVVFTLEPAPLLIWSTSPELWTHISYFTHLVRVNPSQLLYLLDNLPGRAHGILSAGKNLVKSLICNDLDFALPEIVSMDSLPEEITKSNPFEEKSSQAYSLVTYRHAVDGIECLSSPNCPPSCPSGSQFELSS